MITRVNFDQIEFQPSDEAMRASCTQPFMGHDAGCPNYSKTWSCPPNSPPLDEMKARLELYGKIPGLTALFASPCNLCERNGVGSCTCPDVPCRNPDRMHYSLSSHGIDTFATLKNAGLPIETNPETSVCRIGMFCTIEATGTDAIREVCELKIKSLA